MKYTAALMVFVLAAFSVSAQDFDADGVPDSVESALLREFAPLWKSRGEGARPPLPVEWWVRHCQVDITNLLDFDPEGYNGRSVIRDGPGEVICTTGGIQLTVELLNTVFASGGFTCPGYDGSRFYLLDPKDDSVRDGNDPLDPMSWGRLNDENRGVYGRCTRLPGMGRNQYLLQYFLFFGFNSTDVPTGNLGYHEADWLAVDFEVFWDGSASPRMERAVFNNHGRKAFIDSPAGLDWEGGRPVVYMEADTQEPLPWAGGCGFDAAEPIPACVGTNKVNPGFELCFSFFGCWRGGAECEDFQVVREHYGLGPVLDVEAIKNLGELGHPSTDPEAYFIMTFGDRYGWYAEDRFCVVTECSGRALDVASPKGPPFQDKMWKRVGTTDVRVAPFLGCPPSDVVHASPSGVADPTGSSSRPFARLIDALPVVRGGGHLILGPGTYTGDITIEQSVTIESSGGSVTIGG